VKPLEEVDFSRLRSLMFTVEVVETAGVRLFELPLLGGVYVDGDFDDFPMMKRKAKKKFNERRRICRDNVI